MDRRRWLIVMGLAVAVLALGVDLAAAQTFNPVPNPAVNYTKPNYAYSPIMRKFVDSLPGLGDGAANNLGQYIPEGG